MDSVVRNDILSAMAASGARRRGPGLIATSGTGTSRERHRVVELTGSRLVIEAETTPHLSGYVDILRGDERVSRLLVVLSWARNGMAGYEFKHSCGGSAAPADFERPAHTALIDRPATA